MKKIVVTSIACLFVGILHAQITTNEHPYGLKERNMVQKQNSIILTVPNRTLIDAEDSINYQRQGSVRYAYPVLVNYTLQKNIISITS